MILELSCSDQAKHKTEEEAFEVKEGPYQFKNSVVLHQLSS